LFAPPYQNFWLRACAWSINLQRNSFAFTAYNLTLEVRLILMLQTGLSSQITVKISNGGQANFNASRTIKNKVEF